MFLSIAPLVELAATVGVPVNDGLAKGALAFMEFLNPANSVDVTSD